MGNSISTRIEWANSASSADSTIITTVQNENTLSDFTKYVQLLSEKFKDDSLTEFKHPIQYHTNLRPSNFEGSPEFVIHNVGSKVNISSNSLTEHGSPILEIHQIEKDKFSAKISNFHFLNIVLHLSGSMKLKEISSMLVANRDFLNTITGLEGDVSELYLQAFDGVQIGSGATDEKRNSKKRLMRLLLVLNTFDIEILKNTVKSLANNIYVTVPKTTDELKLLQNFCGHLPHHALKSIEWENELSFSNGYRAPPWRQMYGEIAYILVKPVDKDVSCITVSQNGYFINKGYYNDEKGIQQLNYERNGEIYPSLIALLKANSAHFAKVIDHQDMLAKEFIDKEKPKTAGEKSRKAATTVGPAEKEVDSNVNLELLAQEEKNQRTREEAKKSTTKKPIGKKIGNDQPSSRWQNVDITPFEITNNNVEFAHGVIVPKRRKSGHKKRADLDGNSDSENETSEEETQDKRQETSDLPPEYWQIQKLVKYLKIGNQTATIIAICSLKDFDLKNELNQSAIKEVGGLEVLVNLLDTSDPKCKIGSLQILKEITQNCQIRKAISDLDGMKPLVELLRDTNEETLQCLAAETIANCAKHSLNRKTVRLYGGIKKLVKLLKHKNENVARSGALALCSCSRSHKNKEAINNAGAIPLLADLLKLTNVSVLIPIVGILSECASEESYRVAIRETKMIKFLVENLSSQNHELQAHCASAIFKCAEDSETRELVNTYGGLAPLVNLLDHRDNKELLVAATGAVWKCAHSDENVATFNKLKTIKKLVSLMDSQPEDVLVNVVGALGACAKSAEGRVAIRESNGITLLVNLLTGTNQALLVNVTSAVGACASDADCMAIIDRLDGVRLLWSLLKSPHHSVQASAAWAICPCIENAKDAGEMVRSFVGGLELIVSLLKSESMEVLASVCEAIANIAKDEENLAVITDHGVVPLLAKLTNTKHDRLRKHLAEAIARCCRWGNNRVAFGAANAVAPLVKYLKSPDPSVHRSTAQALHQLSMDPENCIAMHENGVVQLLLGMVGSKDEALQEAAAGCIGNIRRLALASEKAAIK